MESASLQLGGIGRGSATRHPAREQPRSTVADFATAESRAALLDAFRNFPRADVEDALSFALEQGLRGLCREEGEASIRSWLETVMLRQLLRQARRRQRVVAVSDAGIELELIAGGSLSPEQVALTAERSRAIARLLDDLPPLTCTVLRARYFEGRSRDEIAVAFGVSPRKVVRELKRGLDAVEAFAVEGTATRGPCDIGRQAGVVTYARGDARAGAGAARHHLIQCQRCREFFGEFRALRWGAGALVPAPATSGSAGAVSDALTEKLAAATSWGKQQLYGLLGRADPAAAPAIRGPGTLATVATCAVIGTAGGATYCATQGFPEPVRDLLPGGETQPDPNSQTERSESAPAADVPPPVVAEPAPAPVGTTESSGAPAPPPPPPEPKPEEFGFEKTVPPPSGSTATSAGASSSSSQPTEPAAAPNTGPGEFGP